MEDASSPKPPSPRPPKLVHVLSSRLQLRHQRHILTPNSSSSSQTPRQNTPTNQQYHSSYPHSSADSTAAKPYECSMCGDVGLKKELFRCRKCSLRYQHTYCSNWYPRKRSYAGICNWCDTDYKSHVYTGTSNVMIKGIKTTAASEVIAPLTLIKSLSSPTDPPCKLSRIDIEEHTHTTTTRSTRNQESHDTNKVLQEPTFCKSRQLTEAATSVLTAKENVEGDCAVARHHCKDSALHDDRHQSCAGSRNTRDGMAASRNVELLQQRPAANHHEAPIETSNSQYSYAAATNKKAARRYKLVSDVY